MISIQRTTEKNLMVFSGRAHPELAEEVVKILGIGLVPTSAYEFANSEIYVRFEESVRGCDAFVIQSHTAPINEWIMERLIMVDALKRVNDIEGYRVQNGTVSKILIENHLGAGYTPICDVFKYLPVQKGDEFFLTVCKGYDTDIGTRATVALRLYFKIK